MLVGQDTAVWRTTGWGSSGLVDLAGGRRAGAPHPAHVPAARACDAMRSCGTWPTQPKLCRYLDIPFQHADPEVLRRMGRWGTRAQYLELLDRARRLMPDVSLRSTFIVGFPGETEEQFEAPAGFRGRSGV